MKRAITILIVSALLLAVQPWPSAALTVVTLDDNGWSADVGDWDPVNRVATLSGDLTQGTGIVIRASNLVLDGKGFALTGDGLGHGVDVGIQSGITIKNLTVKGFGTGIYIESWDSTLSNNTCSGNYAGIALCQTKNSTVDGNTVSGNTGDGIALVGKSTNPSQGNILRNNAVSGNGGAGIIIIECNSSTVTGNLLQGNELGLSMSESFWNEVYRNRFVDNTWPASVFGKYNLFNLPCPIGGNYWSDWTGPDADGDGFVDTPYAFDGGQDSLPWTTPDGWLDDTPPTTTASLSGTPGDNGWYRSDLLVTLAATDNLACGVAGTEYTPDGTTWLAYTAPFTVSAEGTTTIRYHSTDSAGNVEDVQSIVVKIDKTPPTLSGMATTAPNANGWYRGDVTIHWTADDGQSGLDPATVPADSVIDGEGSALSAGPVTVTDLAGNSASATVDGINIDRTAPTITGAATTAPNLNGWYSDEVTVHFEAADSGSGLASLTSDQTLNAEGEGLSVTGTAVDLAGNSASATVDGINIDRTAPSSGIALDPAAPDSNDGWYTSDVEVSLSAADEPGSGIASTEYRLDGDDDEWVAYTTAFTLDSEGATTISYRSTDKAGNVEEAESVTVQIDLTPPTITIATPEPYAVLPLGTTLQFDARDTPSGLATLTATLSDGVTALPVASGYIPGVGVYTLRVEAVDVAGNRAAAERYFVVYDPAAGFVTGNGWIDSPAGAYAADPALAGKASFRFVSRYEVGATVPSGETEFRLKVADLSFHAASYEWLVVTGTRAQYKGVGTINGAGSYGFMLTVTDGEPDRFRIKIWDRATDTLVYDNQLGADDSAEPAAALGGGGIAVHEG